MADFTFDEISHVVDIFLVRGNPEFLAEWVVHQAGNTDRIPVRWRAPWCVILVAGSVFYNYGFHAAACAAGTRRHNGKQKCLWRAVDGREESAPTRLQQLGASGDDWRRIGNMLQHFHASYGIKLARLLLCDLLRILETIVDLQTLRAGMQASPPDSVAISRFQSRTRRFWPALPPRCRRRNRYPTSSAGRGYIIENEFNAQRVDGMQHSHLALFIPPNLRDFIEFDYFLIVSIREFVHFFGWPSNQAR